MEDIAGESESENTTKFIQNNQKEKHCPILLFGIPNGTRPESHKFEYSV